MRMCKGKPVNAWLLASVLALGACSDDSDYTGIEGTGSPQTTEATGSVSSYSSIVVNGVRYDISSAQIEVNGETGALEEAIELGMVVHIQARLDADSQSAEALKVSYDRKLRGSVDQVTDTDLTHKHLELLGQTVMVQDDIVFAGVSFETLAADTTIEVSGFIDDEGQLVASRIAAVTDDADVDLEGRIANLDQDQQTFSLGNLTADYTNAVFVDGARDDLAAGLQVELKGGTRDEQGVLAPAEVHIEADSSASDEGQHLSLEGVVGQFEDQGAFRVQGTPVDASQAQLEGGTQAQLQPGVRVVVEGRMHAGTLQAEQMRLLLPGLTRVRAAVDAVDPDSGVLTLLGNRYQVTPVTGFEDRSARADRFINLDAIAVGEVVEVFARYVEDQLTITRLRRLDGEAEDVTLRGPVTEVNGEALFSVMGVMVDAEGATGGALVSALARGDLVAVEGRRSGTGSMVASLVSVPEHVPCPGQGNGSANDELCAGPPGLNFAGPDTPAARLRF